MRKTIIIALISILGLAATAQDNNGSLNERLFKAKLNELVYRLHISTEQQKKFEPIYRNYCNEMSTLWKERKQPIQPNTSSKAAAIEKRKMEMQQRAQGIRMKYIDKFATVLNPNQVERFYEVESLIQKKLKERKEQSRNK